MEIEVTMMETFKKQRPENQDTEARAWKRESAGRGQKSQLKGNQFWLACHPVRRKLRNCLEVSEEIPLLLSISPRNYLSVIVSFGSYASLRKLGSMRLYTVVSTPYITLVAEIYYTGITIDILHEVSRGLS